jgi:KUP system potassium uptake protein
MIPLSDFLGSLFAAPPHRVGGTAVFFRAEGDGVPHAMLHNLLHNKVLHDRVIFLTVHSLDIPAVKSDGRVQVEPLGHNCFQVNLFYGFIEERNVPTGLALCAESGLEFDAMETSYFIARHNVIATPGAGMAMWRENLYAAMARNARDAADYFKLPSNRVIELGTQVEI